ncbi:beta-1,3-glucanase family protein [Dyella sp.]|uniref:beta-1,3-glucanase family protein n=1 Tax=Dyella sp. TaxID=1869338 RepID=UPI002ED31186
MKHPVVVVDRLRGRRWRQLGAFVSAVFAVAVAAPVFADGVTLAPSQRTDINLGAQPWSYLAEDNGNNLIDGNNASTPPPAAAVNFDDSKWQKVGLPYSTTQFTTFINEKSGGGDGELHGTIGWYRTKLTDSAQYNGKKVTVEFEGAHMGAQVYVNGHFVPTTSAVARDATATHVNGFLPFIVDVTPYLHYDGTDTIAVKVARNGDFFEDPQISGSFRFGQADTGIFRPVRLHVTDKVYIPENVYSGQKTWGTYVGTVAASDDQATVRVQTNVANESDDSVTATLTTQIVDASGKVVATQQDQKLLPAHSIPGADPAPVFDQTLTVSKPTLWYPNNSPWGKPYLYKVFHTVSINGQVIDAKQSTLGIRVITWDKDFPYINGHKHYLWGAAGRYDYPGLASSVPEEQQWRDLAQLAAAGGNLWRPGHSSSSPEFVAAADAYGVFIVQPSGDGENGFANACAGTDNVQQCQDKETLKRELHRDMIIRDRSHPSILAWEANNGTMHEDFAALLKQISLQWDSINSRAQTDRTPDVNNGDVISCDGAGCEVNLHQHDAASKPTYGAEYWSNWGVQRSSYDYELAFALQYLTPWMQGRKANNFGMTQWYFADSPGEIFEFVDGTDQTLVRSMAQSMVDMNRFPRLLYYIYQANWAQYPQIKSIKLAGTWNRPAGMTRVNAFSNCPAVQLMVNGSPVGGPQVPNSWDSDTTADSALVGTAQAGTDLEGNPTRQPVPADVQLAEQTTKLPGQVHWDTAYQPGTVTAQCLDETGAVQASDTLTTAGKPDHILLKAVNELVRPDGTAFELTANGSDTAFVVAAVVDAQNNLVMTGDGSQTNITFAVDGPVEYHGGSEQLVTAGQPLSYHAPGDHELQTEGGLTKIAMRTLFQTGPVTVTATAPGLAPAQVSFNIDAVPNPVVTLGKPSIIAQPVEQDVTSGQTAQFSVAASGAQPMSFHWFKNGQPVGGNSAVLTTDATTKADDSAVYTVDVVNGLGDELSAQAVLHVFDPAPIVIQQAPQAVNVDAGQSAHFAVSATGSPTINYQWLKNNQPIAGAQSPSYDTPVLTTADNATYSVTVSNPVNQITTTPVALTVNAARPPVVTQDPVSVVINPGQPATFSVSVTGSAPFHYQWTKDGVVVGDDASTLTLAKVTPSDTGSYQVTVSNITGQTAVSKAATLKLAPPGANLALNKKTFDSSEENTGAGGTRGEYANDGQDGQNGTANTRWGSAFNNVADADNQWLDIDLGSVRTFNRVVLEWEAAYGSAYKLQYSNDRQTWTDAFCEGDGANCDAAGTGGTEDKTFPSVQARYVRMQGVKRGTAYGYSLLEMQVYDGANCGAAGTSNERFTVNDTETATDNLSKLIWTRTPHIPADESAQLTQDKAAQYCAGIGARLPTVAEAKAISGANAVTCAFPAPWNAWTSETDPNNSTNGLVVSSAGVINSEVATNFPGQAMCVSGDRVLPPVIANAPVSQTVGVGRSAHLTVTATGTGPLSYEWFRNGKSVFVSADPFLDTPAGVLGNNDSYVVEVTSAQGLTVASSAATVTVDDSTNGNVPPPDTNNNNASDPNEGNGGGNNGGGNNGGGNNGGGQNDDNTPGDGHNGVNLALGKTASANGSESGNDGADAGYLDSAQAFDGDIGNTRWSSPFQDEAWLAVDLGAIRTFDHAVLRWERAYSTNYQLETSIDGVTWNTKTPFFTRNPGLGGTERISFAPQTARYVRMHSFARSSQYGVSLYELEVYAAAAPTITTQPATQSVAAGQSALFEVGVQAGGPVSYQWRRGGTAIANATQATYGFVVAQGDTGASFDVVITDANGNATTSQAAVLTVTAANNTGTNNTGGSNGNGDGVGNSGSGNTQPTAGTNLALNKPVKVSGTENDVAFKGANVNDGDPNTRWSSAFADPQWIEIDLGSVQSINRVVLNWENAHATAYQIQVSTDEQHWDTAFDQPKGQGGIENDTFPATVSARYVRMYGTQRNTQYGYSLWEMEIYGDAGAPTQPGGSNPGSGGEEGGGDNGSGGADYTVYPGFIGTTLKNNTHGAYTDDQVYVQVIAQDPATHVFSWLKPDGTFAAMSIADNDASGHLSKNGQNYPNYAFTLAQAKLMKLPKMDSGRIFISLGEPLYIKVLTDANGNIGFAGPNPLNGTDPNIGVRYDWYEFTYNDGGLWINTTQVDDFGLPLLLDVWGDSKNFHQQTGLTETHDALLTEYATEVPAAFQVPLQGQLRIMAPGKSTFDAGQVNQHYFDDYVSQIWTQYGSSTLNMDVGGRHFAGQVVNGDLIFNELDDTGQVVAGGPYIVHKPSTQDILEGKGALATGNATELAIEAQICAAFNRHVMEDSTLWAVSSAYYLGAPANYYARFWHTHGVSGLAYGFAYDDVSNQSSTIHTDKPEHMELGIGW